METENQEEQNTLVDLGDKVKGIIILPKLDLTPYIGKKVKIEKVEEHEGEFGYYVKAISEVVATIDGKDNKKIEIRASKILGLAEDKEGKLGWTEETKTGIFLKKMEVEHYRDLKGMEIIVQTLTSKKGTDFLTFN